MSLSAEDRAIVDSVTAKVDDDLIDDVVDIHRSALSALLAERAVLDRAIAMRERAVINLLERREGLAS